MSGACHMDSDGRSAVWLLVWKRSVASGRLLRVSGEWCGYAFGLPDRHPMVFLASWRGSLPMRSGLPCFPGWVERVARGGLRTG